MMGWKVGLKTILAFAMAAWMGAAHAQEGKPAALKLGITTFLSGPASVFGVPARAAAELWIEAYNAAGGIQGVKLTPTFIDEGLGGDRFLSEYRDRKSTRLNSSHANISY